MNIRSNQQNIESLLLIASRLEEICDEITFVGGCILGLLITDKSAPDVRFTVDVDGIINVITKTDYYALTKKLRQKGFKDLSIGNHPLCRWDCDGILVDIMPTDESILGFSNKWYKDAQKTPIKKTLALSKTINLISAPYFLATKLEAFKKRGQNDFLGSHDLEDIISLIDGRSEIIDDISTSKNNLKQYLASEFSSLLDNESFTHSLPGHLNYSTELEYRHNIVLNRILAIIHLGK